MNSAPPAPAPQHWQNLNGPSYVVVVPEDFLLCSGCQIIESYADEVDLLLLKKLWREMMEKQCTHLR